MWHQSADEQFEQISSADAKKWHGDCEAGQARITKTKSTSNRNLNPIEFR
jgi:hypothetical protein